MRGAPVPLAFTLAPAPCSRADRDVSSGLSAQFDSDVVSVDLAKIGPPDWEQVCVLGPYSANEEAERVLGFK